LYSKNLEAFFFLPPRRLRHTPPFWRIVEMKKLDIFLFFSLFGNQRFLKRRTSGDYLLNGICGLCKSLTKQTLTMKSILFVGILSNLPALVLALMKSHSISSNILKKQNILDNIRRPWTTTTTTTTSTMLSVVKFDGTTNQWITTDPAKEGPEAGYGIWGTVLRGGPVPFMTRLTSPETYEQAVLKYMATDKVDRIVAQANMDKYLENPNDWSYYRTQGMDPDYVTIDTKGLFLRLVWASLVGVFVGRAVYSMVTGEPYNPQ
jgi:hypothetical protein